MSSSVEYKYHCPERIGGVFAYQTTLAKLLKPTVDVFIAPLLNPLQVILSTSNVTLTGFGLVI